MEKGTNSQGNSYKSYPDGSYSYNNGNGKRSEIYIKLNDFLILF